MKKIIVYRTANTTPHLEWDYVAHYEGECERPDHEDLHEFGSTPLLAMQRFLKTIEDQN